MQRNPTFCRQLKALTLKNWRLKKRKPFASCLELLLPVALMALLLLFRAEAKKSHVDQDLHDEVILPVNATEDMTGLSLFVEAMQSEDIKETVESLIPKCAAIPGCAEILDQVLDHFGQKHRFAVVNGPADYIEYLKRFDLVERGFDNDTMMTFGSTHDFDSYIGDKNYGKNGRPMLTSAVQFKNHEKYDYVIRMNVTYQGPDSNFVWGPEGVDSRGPRTNTFSHGFETDTMCRYIGMLSGEMFAMIPGFGSNYTTTGCVSKWRPLPAKVNRSLRALGSFAGLQIATDRWIMEKVSGETISWSTDDYNLRVRPFPTREYEKDIFGSVMQAFLGLCLTLFFIWPVTRIIKGIVEEKELRIKEGMKIMGLKDSSYMLSWMALYAILLGCSSALMTLIVGPSVFPKSDKFIVFLCFFLFTYSSFAYAYLVSSIFTRSKLATVLGAVTFLITQFLTAAIPNDRVQEKGTYMFACLANTICSGQVFGVIINQESTGTGTKFNNLYTEIQNFDVGSGMFMLLFDIFLYLALAIYIENVLPQTYGVRKNFYFCCMPSFWCKKKKNYEIEEVTPMQSSANVQTQPLKVNVAVRGLRKVFNTTPETVAVNRISLDMYGGQIFCLLGHNGAGKTTTIRMLTGMFPATDGDAHVNDQSILQDLDGIRSQTGFCPQHDILYDNLTVREHLELFCDLKGVPSEECDSIIEEMIDRINFREKINALSCTLSGGQKRKLSTAIALIGGSEVVFLDEPTSGMDVAARRELWDLLKREKNDRVIVLTTHFMDEADYLGDRIAIMSQGNVKCCGSSLFLKNLYGVGYNLTIVKSEKISSSVIREFVETHVPNTEVITDVAGEVSLRLPFDASANFPPLFDGLDQQSERFGIQTYGISITTLEEVFLRVESDEIHFDKSEREQTLETKSFLKRQRSDPNSVVSSDNFEDGPQITTVGGKHSVNTVEDNDLESPLLSSFYPYPNLFTHIFAIVIKRVRNIMRDRKAWCCQIAIPFIIMMTGLGLITTFTKKGQPTISMIASDYNTPLYIPVQGAWPMNGVKDSGTNYVTVSDSEYMPQYLVDSVYNRTTEKYYHWTSRYGGYTVQNSTTPNYTLWVNTTGYDAVPTFISLFNRNWFVSHYPSKKNMVWSTKYEPFPLTQNQKSIITMIGAIYIALALCFVPASLATFIVRERSLKLKHLQMVSGVNIVAYWFANWIFDTANGLVATFLTVIVLYIFNVWELTGKYLPATILLLLLYGFASSSFTYMQSFFFSSHTSAQNFLLLFNILTGPILGIVVGVLTQLTNYPENLNYIWRIFPPFALLDGLLRIIAIQTNLLDSDSNVYSLQHIGYPCLYLGIVGTGSFLVVILIEYLKNSPLATKYFNMNLDIPAREVTDDHDVAAEQERVFSGQSADRGDIIRLHNLRKVYPSRAYQPPNVAVHGLTFGVAPGEVFGFLGANGAGKTTTLKMLTGDLLPSNGTAVMAGLDMLDNMLEVRKLLGYCPQFDALLPTLTGREHLYLFARIKGVPEYLLPQYVNGLIEQLGLGRYADKPSGGYSGGNKRKLSVGIALVGDPKIVFLDEPSTGMDPGARRDMWRLISETMAGRSVVLTTHSMEEAEALCNGSRIGIMVKGRLRCVGGAQHLKSRYGAGYQIDVNLENEDVSQMQKWSEEQFGAVELLESHGGHSKFRIPKKKSLAEIFRLMESVRDKFKVKEYAVSESTLEQIFINIKRQADFEALNDS